MTLRHSHLNAFPLLGPDVASIDTPPHILHDDVSAPPVDKDNVPQSRKPLLVLAVQGCQTFGLVRGARVQLSLLGAALDAVDLLGAETGVGA